MSRQNLALAFLGREQLPNGEFPTVRGRYPELEDERSVDSTTFATTYVLHALGYVQGPRARELAERAAGFLEAEMERHGVWRYWTARDPRHAAIPADLDDTCCASAALRGIGRRPPENTRLILANRNRAGLFYTWLAPRPARTRSRAFWSVTLRQAPVTLGRLGFWRTAAVPWDVDCIVNANVLHYLGDRVDATPVVEYLARALAEGRAATCDKWHTNACAFYYAVSRAYAGGVTALEALREPLAEAAAEAVDNPDDLTPAEVALGACALINLGHNAPALDVAIGSIEQTQRADGSWPAFALWGGGPKSLYGWGSEALTTALCLEAIVRFTANRPASRDRSEPIR